MFQASAGRPEINAFDARGKPCKQEWPNLAYRTGRRQSERQPIANPARRGTIGTHTDIDFYDIFKHDTHHGTGWKGARAAVKNTTRGICVGRREAIPTRAASAGRGGDFFTSRPRCKSGINSAHPCGFLFRTPVTLCYVEVLSTPNYPGLNQLSILC